MARFFFDLREGAELHPDQDGTECAGLEAAASSARRLLGELARDRMRGEEYRTDVMVRDEAGETVFAATLTMVSARLGPQDPHKPLV